MKFDILVLSNPNRFQFLSQLRSVLEPQCFGKDARMTVRIFDSSLSLGANREAMRQASEGEYIAFVDDDDLVASDYVDRILEALETNPDYVGFKVKMLIQGRQGPMAIHSLRFGKWSSNYGWKKNPDLLLERDISHLNPIRRDLALAIPMEGERGEDDRWAKAMSALGIVKTESFIDAVMYHYLWRGKWSKRLDATDWKAPWRLEMIDRLRPRPRPAASWNKELLHAARLRRTTPDALRERLVHK